MKRNQVQGKVDKASSLIAPYKNDESLHSPIQKMQQTIQMNSKLFRCQSDESKAINEVKSDRQ